MEKDLKGGRGKGLAPALEFNHAMIYSRDVDRALSFYRDRLGFKVIEDMESSRPPCVRSITTSKRNANYCNTFAGTWREASRE